MTTTAINTPEYCDMPLASIVPSPTNPRRRFDEAFLKEMAASIRINGVLTPLLVRPKDDHLEIVFGEQRYRAAQIAEALTVPVRIREMTDAQVLEAQLVENLQRRDVHPMEEAQGFKALLDLDGPKYSIELIATRTGKSAEFVATRLKLVDLIPAVVDAFYRDDIGVGHALLLARLQRGQQEQALGACFREDWAGGSKSKRILLPVRHLQSWIEQNVLLLLKDAPFSKRDAQLVPTAGSCLECPKSTGHSKLLFSDFGKLEACSDPACYQAKVSAHIASTIAAKPELVQISTAYGGQKEGSPVLPRNKYTELRKPTCKEDAKRPEFKVCKHIAEAIITEGIGVGTLQKVCVNPSCPVHHPKQQRSREDERWKAEQEKQRKEQAIANATGLRVLTAVSAAVPVRLMKRDLLFVLERLVSLMDERRIESLARLHGIRQKRDEGGIAKTFSAFLRRADEGTLSRMLVEAAILLAASKMNPAIVLRDAATAYKVDTDAIAAKVKQEFAAKAKAQAVRTDVRKPPAKIPKKAVAA